MFKNQSSRQSSAVVLPKGKTMTITLLIVCLLGLLVQEGSCTEYLKDDLNSKAEFEENWVVVKSPEHMELTCDLHSGKNENRAEVMGLPDECGSIAARGGFEQKKFAMYRNNIDQAFELGQGTFVFQIMGQIETQVPTGHFSSKLFTKEIPEGTTNFDDYFLRFTGDKKDGVERLGLDFFANGNHYTWTGEALPASLAGGFKARLVINPDDTYVFSVDDAVLGAGSIHKDFKKEGNGEELSFSGLTVEAVAWEGFVEDSEYDGIFAAYYLLTDVESEADDYYQHVIDTIQYRRNVELDAAFSGGLKMDDGNGNVIDFEGAEQMGVQHTQDDSDSTNDTESVNSTEAEKEDL